MFTRFPRLILKENRKALSMIEARMWMQVAKEKGKLSLFGLYSFTKWLDGKPDPSSVVIDVIALKGPKETLAKLGEKFLRKKRQSLFLFDGQVYLLIVENPEFTPLEKIKEPTNTTLIRDIYFKFTYPGTINGHTGKKSEIIKRFKIGS